MGWRLDKLKGLSALSKGISVVFDLLIFDML